MTTPSPSSDNFSRQLSRLKQGVLHLVKRLLHVIEPLIRRIQGVYRQEMMHLANVLAPQKTKWVDPLWNNLKPLVLPLFIRTRDWLWQPFLSLIERLAPRQVEQWRSLTAPRRHQILFWTATALLVLALIIPDSHKSRDYQAVIDPDIIDLSQDLMEPNSPPWVVDVKAVEVMPFSETLRVSGKVEFDQQRVARIGATVTGRVTEILAMPGQEIDRGTVLARINSTELGQAQLAFLKARAANELAERAYDRATILFKEDVIAKADLQRRQSEAETTAAERRAMADQLRVLGMLPEQIEALGKTGNVNSIAAVTSSIEGTVVERKIVLGQVVQPSDALYTVADLSEVWVTAQVPEQDGSLLAIDQPMRIEIPALANQKFEGKLAFVGELVSNETRTIPARTVLLNPDRMIKPGMLATLLISGKPADRPVVPATAVVREDGYDHVFVALGDNQYKLVVVKLGPETNGLRPVLSGLEPGNLIVTQQAYHLNTERKKRLSGG
jgi:cobalt-zinc-cadmium efflux system membrane fusion protein